MEELKACPFCGKKPELDILEVDLNGSATKDVFRYSCDECGIYMPEFDDFEDARDKWNTRASGWISVKDQEPPIYQLCDVWHVNQFGEEVRACNVIWDGESWYVDLDDEDPIDVLKYSKVTHWMRTPTAPRIQ